MKTSESIVKISAALLKAQKNMGAAAKDVKNPFYKSKYADLGSVMEVVKEPLNEQGISILQPIYSQALVDGALVHFIETILLHESGEFISSSQMKLELTKMDMQQFGSAITYGRRYQMQSLLSIPALDDDGQAAVGKPMPPVATTNPPLPTGPLPASPVKPTFKQHKADNGVF